MMSSKRPRSSTASDASTSPTTTTSPPSKSYRTSATPPPDARATPATPSHPLLCTLPPTCNRRPTPIANARDLEAHYAKYHAHVCEQAGCACVFPEPRLLELHQTECHDPLAEIRKEKGEKIFACHLASCPKLFATPKTRRLHLIQAHGYPKEYFFAVTNKGVGGLLKKWGEGASLIRGEWKARHPTETVVSANGRNAAVDSDEEEQSEAPDNNSDDAGMEIGDATPRTRPVDDFDDHGSDRHTNGIESLADSMSSLSLVPPSIRFGRGGKRGGFGHQHQQHPQHPAVQPFRPHTHTQQTHTTGGPNGKSGGVNGANGHNHNHVRKSSTDVSADDQATPRQHQQSLPARGRALGHRGGRGRAGFSHHTANGHAGHVAMDVDRSAQAQATETGTGPAPNVSSRGIGGIIRVARGRGRGRGRAQVI